MSPILFITQKVDKDDDILGVYHRWLEVLAKKVSGIYVICLYKGRVELPKNVRVFSLGKELGRSRIKYVWRFYKYLWQLRNSYDKVFVHMNPEYVLLAGLYWRLTGRKIVFWYNHPLGSIKARFAILLAHRVLYTSPFSYAAKYKKSIQMPVGVDTDFIKPDPSISKKKNSILYLGRISPIKNINVLIKAVAHLKSEIKNLKLEIVGSPTPGKVVEEDYARHLKTIVRELGLEKGVVFQPAVPYLRIASVYNQHTIFVNLTPTGSFDKTILEAMACELVVLASNRSLQSLFGPKLKERCLFQEGDSQDLAKKLGQLLALGPAERAAIGEKLRAAVVKNHSLERLTTALLSFLIRTNENR